MNKSYANSAPPRCDENPAWVTAGLELRQRNIRDRQFMNVDGVYVDFDPCVFRCEDIARNYLTTDKSWVSRCSFDPPCSTPCSLYLGAVATAPATFMRCSASER